MRAPEVRPEPSDVCEVPDNASVDLNNQLRVPSAGI